MAITTPDLKVFCSQWLQAWSGNQPEKLLGFYSDTAFYRDPGKPEGITGKEALKRYFTKLLAANPNWKWTAVEIIPTEKGFTLKWKAEIPTSKGVLIEHGLDIVEIHHKLITRNEVYFDLSRLI